MRARRDGHGLDPATIFLELTQLCLRNVRRKASDIDACILRLGPGRSDPGPIRTFATRTIAQKHGGSHEETGT